MPIIDDLSEPTARMGRDASTSVGLPAAPASAGILHLGLGSFHLSLIHI